MIFKEPEKTFSKTWVVCICAIFCSMLWGSAFACVKYAYGLFRLDTAHVPTLILFAGVRFTLAGVFVIIFISAARRKILLPGKRSLKYVGLVALFQTCLQYTFFYIGVANTSGVKSSVLNGLGVFFTILAACFVYRTEKFGAVKFAGCALGFSGVVLINFGKDFSFDFSPVGEGFIIISCVCSAMAAGLVKTAAAKCDTSAICGWQFFTGGIVLTAVGAAAGGRINYVDTGAAFMLLYLAFLSACAFTLQGFLLRFNPVSKIAVFKSANPVFGAAFSALLLKEYGEILGLNTLFALLCVCSGIFIVNKFGERRPKIKKNE